MNDLEKIKQDLSSDLPPLREGCRNELRSRLLMKPQNHSIFNILILNMKKYSFAYLAFLITFSVLMFSIFPRDLNGAEVLAKTLEQYNYSEDIYHEVNLTEFHGENSIAPDFIEEVYSDNSGNTLSLMKDPETKNINKIYLRTDGVSYLLPSEDWINPDQRITCIKNYDDKEEYGQDFLKIDMNDYNNFVIDGWGHIPNGLESALKSGVNLEEFDEFYFTAGDNLNADMLDINLSKDFIENLIETVDYEYEFDGEYYVFQDRGLSFYINENYKLEYYEYHPDFHNNFTRVIIQTQEVLNSNENSFIFDPEYWGLINTNILRVSELNLENGCYDS